MDDLDKRLSALTTDFSKVENIRFNCLQDCGKCCFYQAPILTTSEINRMLSYIKTLSKEDLENFSLDCISWVASESTGERLRQYMESLSWFWSPFQLELGEGNVILVRNYTVHSMPSTGRCILLNPLLSTCLAYPERPDTCRLYPFTEKTGPSGELILELAMNNCPGITKGTFNLDQEEILRLRKKSVVELVKDEEARRKYLADNNIMIKPLPKKFQRKETKDIDKAIHEFETKWRDSYFSKKKGGPNYKGKRFVEPLAELGLIPKHPLLELWNKQFDQGYSQGSEKR